MTSFCEWSSRVKRAFERYSSLCIIHAPLSKPAASLGSQSCEGHPWYFNGTTWNWLFWLCGQLHTIQSLPLPEFSSTSALFSSPKLKAFFFLTSSVGFLPNLFVFLQGHTQWHSFLAFFFKEFVGKVTDFYVLLLNSTALLSFFFHWSYESVHFLSLCNTYSKCLMPLTTNLRISVHSLLSYVFKVFSICSRFFCLHTFKSILYLGQHCKYHSVGCRVF